MPFTTDTDGPTPEREAYLDNLRDELARMAPSNVDAIYADAQHLGDFDVAELCRRELRMRGQALVEGGL